MVHNRTREKAEALGAKVADSPGEVVEKCGVVITMLPGPPEVRAVLAREGGLLDGTQEGSLIVDMSTPSPSLARALHRTARGEAWGRSTPPWEGRLRCRHGPPRLRGQWDVPWKADKGSPVPRGLATRVSTLDHGQPSSDHLGRNLGRCAA